MLRGWGARDSNWDFSAELQHELLDGLSMSTGYYHNTAGYPFSAAVAATIVASKVRVQDNVLVGPSDYDSYSQSRRRSIRSCPAVGGYEICDLADINPAKFGQNESLLRRLSGSEEYKFYNDFFNLSFDARLPEAPCLAAGLTPAARWPTGALWSIARRSSCTAGSSRRPRPRRSSSCSGSLPLPGDVIVSGAYQNMSGPPFGANIFVSNSEVKQSLGRDLSGSRQSVSVPLVGPQTLFLPRVDRSTAR